VYVDRVNLSMTKSSTDSKIARAGKISAKLIEMMHRC